MPTFSHNLGFDDAYPLTLDYVGARQELRISVDRKSDPWPRLVNAIEKKLQIYSVPSNDGPSMRVNRQDEGDTIVFRPIPHDFTLKLNTEVIGNYHIDQTGNLTRDFHREATCSEIRRIGTFHNTDLYPQHAEDAELIEKAKKAVFTDVHTHSSGHISAAGLLNVAMKHNAYYPLSLMEEAGIDISYENFSKNLIELRKRVEFKPTDTPGMPDFVDSVPLRSLKPDDLAKLKRYMAMPGDKQSTYPAMETDAYRFRYPLTKNPDLLPDTIRETARELIDQGISYAEISYVGLDKPDLLQALHETMHDIEQDPEFASLTMRFLNGVPRGLTLGQTATALEKSKVLMDSPYIVGIDLLGQEVTKTRRVQELLSGYCDWAEKHKPGSTIRMHAGENDKNPENVEEVLDLALAHPHLFFRIGHGIYGWTKSAIEKAKKLCADPEHPRIIIESNPDSVLSLNNINGMNELSFDLFKKNGIPFVIGSDSSGTYNTSPAQLGLAAYYAGLDEEGFDLLIKHQKTLVNRQLDYSNRIADSVQNFQSFDGKMSLASRMLKKLEKIVGIEIDEEKPATRTEVEKKLREDEVQLVTDTTKVPGLKGRIPVTLVGASGDRWDLLTDEAKTEVKVAFDMLAHALDPRAVTFDLGRPKAAGLNYVVKNSTRDANQELKAEGKKPFYTVSTMVGPIFNKKHDYSHLTHMVWLENKSYLHVAREIINHTFGVDETQPIQGILIAAGGGSFTNDIINEADQRDILADTAGNKKMMFLFENANGASAEKAKLLNPEYRVGNGIDIIKKIHAVRPEIFRPEFDIRRVNDLYQESLKRVETYPEETPDPQHQIIGDIVNLQQQQRGKQS